jgi:hypothetical protein
MNKFVKINENVRNTPLSHLEGAHVVVKRTGKNKTVINFLGFDISIKNENITKI